LVTNSAGDLDGRVAIVTGSGGLGGIGETTARALAEAGARVMLADVATSELEEVWSGLAGEGLDVARRPVDISDEADVRALVGFTVETFGRLDVLDNNAASNHLVPLDIALDLDVELWDTMFAVITRGTMLMCKHAVKEMAKQGKGSIINISSGKSLSGDIDQAAYSAAKNGVNALTCSVATMFGKQGIRCNTVSPGVIQTALMKAVVPEHMADLYRENNALDYLGEPRDIAELVVFLASDRSKYITGQLISVDGGYHSHAPIVAQIRRLAGEMRHLTPLETDDPTD
jgi:NAD(P)-dependent dehydrogenase (short-subunit alcohol dehydrogenase family)